ncbi:ABC transporter ATP-binding protein [Cellulomonas fimi]|uniref:ABC transporter ATP-binding protein n=1 Tax=Cellulomonas fimi TaxID=1708 RepID=UPI0023580EDD|nr:ABC transporter ATP-binding protein [Cellulomonas fimi]
MTGPAIQVSHLSKHFKLHQERRNSLKERVVRGKSRSDGTFRALDGVSFDVERGTTIGLIGHNGSGKSTLLKILAGVYRPTSGAVRVDGRVSALLELGAGFHGELTGRENIYLNGAILGLTRKQIEASIDDIIEFAGLGEFIDSPVKIYSSGMYVRLGFAIAVTLEPEILIVDEIIAVGDEEFQRKCFDHLFRLRNQGTTIVLVTHSMGLAAELCDSAVWLDHGTVRAAGKAPEVIDAYLADVNQQEARTNDEPGTVRTGLDAIRSGSGEVQVLSVEALDELGQPLPVVLTNEPLTLRVHFEAKEPVQDVTIGIGFIHENGIGIGGSNTRQHGVPISLEPGVGYIDYSTDRLDLMPANWRMSTAVRSHGHVYDMLEKAFPLPVRSSGGDDGGAVRLHGRWGDVVREGAPATAPSAAAP